MIIGNRPFSILNSFFCKPIAMCYTNSASNFLVVEMVVLRHNLQVAPTELEYSWVHLYYKQVAPTALIIECEKFSSIGASCL